MLPENDEGVVINKASNKIDLHKDPMRKRKLCDIKDLEEESKIRNEIEKEEKIPILLVIPIESISIETVVTDQLKKTKLEHIKFLPGIANKPMNAFPRSKGAWLDSLTAHSTPTIGGASSGGAQFSPPSKQSLYKTSRVDESHHYQIVSASGNMTTLEKQTTSIEELEKEEQRLLDEINRRAEARNKVRAIQERINKMKEFLAQASPTHEIEEREHELREKTMTDAMTRYNQAANRTANVSDNLKV